jgi:IclR family transcriptional regulator, KDG regulon repressor
MKSMNRPPKEGFYNRSLERALQILCLFKWSQQTLTLSQLSEASGLHKTTVLRLCSTLMKYDFLRYSQVSRHYSLGLKLFELGSIIFSSFSLRRIASTHLDQLQARLGKTVFLGILESDELIYIDKKEDPRIPIRFTSQIGTRRPPHFGMLGQILLAFLPDQEVSRLLRKAPLTLFTKKSLTSEKAFKERLLRIRKQGFFVDEEEALDGISGISAPIRDYTGEVIAGVGVGFISSSEDAKGKKIIIKQVCETATGISKEMGYRETKRLHRVSPANPTGGSSHLHLSLDER